MQAERYHNTKLKNNAELQLKDIEKYCQLNDKSEKILSQAYERLNGRGTPVLFVNGKSMNGFHPQRFRQFWMEATGETLPDSRR